MRFRYVSGQLEVDQKDYVDQEIISASFPALLTTTLLLFLRTEVLAMTCSCGCHTTHTIFIVHLGQ